MFKRRIKRTFAEKLKIHTILLFAIFAIGAYMILANLGSLSLHMDDVFHGLSAEGILEHGYPRLPSGIIYPRGITQSYAIAFFSLFFGLSEFTVVLPAALSGLGTILLVYLLGKKIGGKEVGLIAAFTITFFPWHIEFSRWGRFYALSLFLILLSLYSFIRGFLETNGSNFWKVMTGISVTLASLAIESGLFLVPLFLIIGIFYRRVFHLKKNIFWIILFISIIPIARFLGELNIVSPSFPKLVGDSSPGVLHTLFGVLAQFMTTKINYELFNLYYAMFTFSIIAIACGAIILLKTHDMGAKKSLFFLLLFVFVLGSLLQYPRVTQSSGRSLYPTVPIVILLGFVSVKVITNFAFKIFTWDLNNSTTLQLKKIITISLMVLLAFTIINIPDSWNIHNKKHGDLWAESALATNEVYKHPDTRTISTYVLTNKKPEDVVITNIPPFYYFYTNEKPDYWIWRGGAPSWAVYEENGDLIYKYLGHTKTLSTFDELEEVVANANDSIWIVMQHTYEGPDISIKKSRFENWMEGLNAEVVFVGEEPGAVVYHIQ